MIQRTSALNTRAESSVHYEMTGGRRWLYSPLAEAASDAEPTQGWRSTGRGTRRPARSGRAAAEPTSRRLKLGRHVALKPTGPGLPFKPTSWSGLTFKPTWSGLTFKTTGSGFTIKPTGPGLPFKPT